ncbi:hypothetical protein ABOY03_15550, partial [Clavibacter michiganensis]
MPSSIPLPRSIRTSVSLLAVVGLAVGLGACTTQQDALGILRPVTAAPDAPLTVVGQADDSDASIAMSGSLFRQAPVAVLAPAGDVAAQELGAEAAVALGAPLLVQGQGAESEIERLGSSGVLAVGDLGDDVTSALPGSTTVVRADRAA